MPALALRGNEDFPDQPARVGERLTNGLRTFGEERAGGRAAGPSGEAAGGGDGPGVQQRSGCLAGQRRAGRLHQGGERAWVAHGQIG